MIGGGDGGGGPSVGFGGVVVSHVGRASEGDHLFSELSEKTSTSSDLATGAIHMAKAQHNAKDSGRTIVIDIEIC